MSLTCTGKGPVHIYREKMSTAVVKKPNKEVKGSRQEEKIKADPQHSSVLQTHI